jgi:hypothetical protein
MADHFRMSLDEPSLTLAAIKRVFSLGELVFFSDFSLHLRFHCAKRNASLCLKAKSKLILPEPFASRPQWNHQASCARRIFDHPQSMDLGTDELRRQKHIASNSLRIQVWLQRFGHCHTAIRLLEILDNRNPGAPDR